MQADKLPPLPAHGIDTANHASVRIRGFTDEQMHAFALLAIAEASEGLRADAMRYRWMREWFVRGGKLSEIAPAGHILRTTNAIVDSSIDAALSGAVTQGEG